MLPFCPRCGAESKPGRASCWNCWAALDVPEPKGKKKATKAPAPSKKPSPADLVETPVLFLFNSSATPDTAGNSYSAYSETEVLRHLFTQWIESGAGDIAQLEMQACHGDLFEEHELGPEASTLKPLIAMLGEKTTDGSLLSQDMRNQTKKKAKPLGFNPYAVGLAPVRKSIALAMDKALKKQLGAFYLGVVRFAPSANVETIAEALGLPASLSISQGQCLGDWDGLAPAIDDLPPMPTSAAAAALLEEASISSLDTTPSGNEAAQPARKSSLFAKGAKKDAKEDAAPAAEKPKKSSLFVKKSKEAVEGPVAEVGEMVAEKPKKPSLFAKKPKDTVETSNDAGTGETIADKPKKPSLFAKKAKDAAAPSDGESSEVPVEKPHKPSLFAKKSNDAAQSVTEQPKKTSLFAIGAKKAPETTPEQADGEETPTEAPAKKSFFGIGAKKN